MQLRHSPDLQRLLSAARHVEAVSWTAGYVDNNRRIHKVVYIIGVTLSLLRLCFDPLGLPQRVAALADGVEPSFLVRNE